VKKNKEKNCNVVDYNAYEYILCNIDTIFNYVNIGCNKYYYDDYCKVNLKKKKNMIAAKYYDDD